MKFRTATFLWERFSKKSKDDNASLDKSRLKVEIERVCGKYLEVTDDLIEFEVRESDLDNVISIIETNMINRYDIFQVNKTLFSARLKEVDLI